MSGGSLLGVLLRLAFSLGLVLGLMALAARALRNRQLGPGTAGRRTSVAIEVLGRQALGRNAGIAVVRVADRAMLVGITESSVSVLTDLAPDAFPEQPAPTPRVPGSPPGWGVVIEALRERTVRRGSR